MRYLIYPYYPFFLLMKHLTIFFLILLSACQSGYGFAVGNQSQPTSTQVFLITAGDDATRTMTPFFPFLDETPTFFEFHQPTLYQGTSTLFIPPTFDPRSVLATVGTPVSLYAPPYAPSAASILTDDQTVTFLLLGSDQRSSTQKYFRTDVLVIAALRPATMQVSLISLPRDLYVYIPTVGMDRVNTAYEYGIMYDYPGGGTSLLKDTILYNLGVRIDHLAMVDFDGFRKIVDTLGGVDVPVYCQYTDWHLISPELDETNEDNWELFTVGPGLEHMDGDLALWYARSRSKSSDFDRGRRSQEVLRALYGSVRSGDVIGKIPELYEDLKSTIKTDLGLRDLLLFAPLALELNNADIRSFYIGKGQVSSWTTPGGASVQLPNGPAVQALLQQALVPREKEIEEEEILIEIRNGTTYPGWDSLAAERLNYAGYETRLAPADHQNYSQTLLYDLSASPDLTQVAGILTLLGLEPSSFVSAPMTSDVDFVLVLGNNYQPCFNPTISTP